MINAESPTLALLKCTLDVALFYGLIINHGSVYILYAALQFRIMEHMNIVISELHAIREHNIIHMADNKVQLVQSREA